MSSLRIRSTLSSLQKKRRNTWPDPESSVGKFCGTRKGKYKCWEAKGPAQEAFQQISIEISEVLARDCGPVPSSKMVVFDIFMIGKSPATSVPQIMFSCEKPGPREEALAAVRKAEILNNHTPGIQLGQWDCPPHIKNPQLLGSSTEYAVCEIPTKVFRSRLIPIFDEEQPRKLLAMRLHLASSSGSESLCKATVGGIVEFAGKRFYLAPAHIFTARDSSQDMASDDESQDGDSDCEFGGFDDEEETDYELDEVEFMSQFSITPESSDVESGGDVDSGDGPSNSGTEDNSSVEPQEESAIGIKHRYIADFSPFAAEDTVGQVHAFDFEIKTPILTSAELDFALIEVDENDHNTVALPTLSWDNVCLVGAGDVDVTVVTGSGKILTGILSCRPSYIRLPNTRRYKEAFVVNFEECPQPGDCGSIIRSSRTGEIYGHIIAGSVESKVAYIIPAADVLKAMEQKANVSHGYTQSMEMLSQSSRTKTSSDANGEHATAEDQSVRPSTPPQTSEQTLTHEDYTVGIICVLPLECKAACRLLLEQHPALSQEDSQSYFLGTMGNHNVVITNPVSEAFESKSASEMALQMLSLFPSIRFALSLGIGHSFSTPSKDIRLGDIVVSTPGHSHGGLIQYNFDGTNVNPQVQKIEMLYAPPENLLATVSRLQKSHAMCDTEFPPFPQPRHRWDLTRVKIEFQNTYKRLGSIGKPDCPYCNEVDIVQGHDNPDNTISGPMIYYGLIVSGNQALERSQVRDLCSRENHDILCYEMEATGWMNSFPCLFIRGISNYADPRLQTTEDWREYAAEAAAGYLSELLFTLSVPEVLKMTPVRELMHGKQLEHSETIDPSIKSIYIQALENRSFRFGDEDEDEGEAVDCKIQ